MTDETIRIASDALSATVAPLGAEMQNLRTAAGNELLWHGDPAWWGGRAPMLFPIVGRAPGDRVAVGDHEAEMRQHGFARRSVFELAEQQPDRCRHLLRDSKASRAVYPFAFEIAAEHRIEGATLSVSVSVTNRDTRPMPFGFGFHPAFRWPLPGAEKQPHRITLANGAEPAMARLSPHGLLPDALHASPFAAGQLTLDPAMFEADAMIFPEGAGAALTYGADDGPRLEFAFENLPNLAIWSKPGAPFVCIEPWHGMAARQDASPQIAERPWALDLPAGESARFGWRITHHG